MIISTHIGSDFEGSFSNITGYFMYKVASMIMKLVNRVE